MPMVFSHLRRHSRLLELTFAISNHKHTHTHTQHKTKKQISVKDGSAGGLDGIDPTLSWSTSSASGDLNLEYGVEASVRPTSDLASLPKSVWGKVSGSSSGWGWSARADIDTADLSSADLEIDASNEDGDLTLNVLAAAGSDGISVGTIEATKTIDNDDSTITVSPKYDVGSGDSSVTLGWSSGDTEVEVLASADAQSVTISQQLDDENKVSPTVTSDGDVSVAWEKALGDDGSLTTTLTSKSVDLEWEDGAWTANINVPVDGTSIEGTNIGIKRDVTF